MLRSLLSVLYACRRLTIGALCLFAFVAARAQADDIVIDQHLRDSLTNQLAKATTPADSLARLLDLFDASGRLARIPYGEQAYDIAIRQGDNDAALSLLLLLSNSYTNDYDKTQELLDRLQLLPDSPARREAIVYIKLRLVYIEARTADPASISAKIKPMVNNRLDSNGDIYADIERLFTICIYLHSLYDQSDLLAVYFDKLEPFINQLPSDQWALRNLYYSQAAFSYSLQNDAPRAMVANRKLIAMIEKLQQYYGNQGRKYRNLDIDYYNCYHRMLSNYAALTPAELDDIYGRLMNIVERNDVARSDLELCGRPTIYYYMGRKEYAKALPLLRQYIDKPVNVRYGFHLNRAMIDAAAALGDTSTELEASRRYIDLLQDYIHTKSERTLQELGVLYDLREQEATISRLNADKVALVEANQAQTQASHNRRVYFSLAALAVFVVLALVLAWQWRRSRMQAAKLNRINAELTAERDALQRTQTDLMMARDQAKDADRRKTDFINLISHQIKTPLQAIAEYTGLIIDCMEPDKKKYLARYGDIVSLNTELILTFVNDITEISSLEARKVDVRYSLTDIDRLCRMAIGSIEPRVPEDIHIELEGDASNAMVNTDARRLEQIITNLLENAVKFSEKGTVLLSYAIDRDRHRLTVSVTDHGPGIPADKHELVFERFTKLDPSSVGMGLGLYTTRLLVKLLGGEIHIDRAYHDGARFVVTVPLSNF